MADTAPFDLDVALPAAKAVTDREDGDIIIEGLAADFNPDREDEAFVPGAFSKAIDKFLGGQASLLYHHHNDQQLGQVLELTPRDDGLWMKAVIPKPADSSPLLDVYHKVRRGMMRGLSVRGVFRKARTPAGVRIHDVDLAEISVTPFPVGPGALFQVAQKAFDEEDCGCEDRKAVHEFMERRFAELESAYDDIFEGAEVLAAKGAPTAEQRKKYGMADGAFPIWHCGSGPGGVGAAKSDLGRTKKPREQVMAHIRRRAKALGCPEKAQIKGDS